MPRISRLLISCVFGLASALLLPVYPLRSEVRSFGSGGSGDQISHHWSTHTLFGLLEELQYESSKTAPRLAALAIFAILAAVCTRVALGVLKRMF